MLILLVLVLAALSVAPVRRGDALSTVRVAPDWDDGDGQNVPPPRREFAI